MDRNGFVEASTEDTKVKKEKNNDPVEVMPETEKRSEKDAPNPVDELERIFSLHVN